MNELSCLHGSEGYGACDDEAHHLAQLADWFAACGMEALLLGCTHFPYFKEALARRTSLPLIDPTQEMLELLQA